MRIMIGREKYLIWHKGLSIGDGTKCEDLWNNGYRFFCRKILGIKFLIAYKRRRNTDL